MAENELNTTMPEEIRTYDVPMDASREITEDDTMPSAVIVQDVLDQEAGASETAASETAASETAASETAASETAATETEATETETSETEASETKASETEATEVIVVEEASGTGESSDIEVFIDENMRIVEALIFASDEPITFAQLREVIAPGEAKRNTDKTEVVAVRTEAVEENGEAADTAIRKTAPRKRPAPRFTITALKSMVDRLNESYRENGNAFRVIEIAGGFSFQTTPAFGGYVGQLYAERTKRRLTQAALETLAIIAFKQPISKPSIETIRGVNVDFVIKSLLERNLISIVGREDTVGRPLLYGTTKFFLKHFGLRSLNDLPKPREIEELIGEEETIELFSIDENDAMPGTAEPEDGGKPGLFDTMKNDSKEHEAPEDVPEMEAVIPENAPAIEGIETEDAPDIDGPEPEDTPDIDGPEPEDTPDIDGPEPEDAPDHERIMLEENIDAEGIATEEYADIEIVTPQAAPENNTDTTEETIDSDIQKPEGRE
jgi:segregation and condensation protein B